LRTFSPLCHAPADICVASVTMVTVQCAHASSAPVDGSHALYRCGDRQRVDGRCDICRETNIPLATHLTGVPDTRSRGHLILMGATSAWREDCRLKDPETTCEWSTR
jgi:hypothetical protein